ncbi:hypothetical protein [Acidocella sp. KAb 2-4]|uniref:hypothetical protein n=1 Tax=Acidocella sp. KAb 2-4 TaxID=2885158 RepID=UPI001D081693|nr:hypothetical protein [Acidocella sp. KAb 2-4]MCB5945845.1 hypothetical protein [Acidocella sp. KAb 2-4]
MCRNCADGAFQLPQEHARVLQLLALLEHPDALPRDDALRIASGLLAWTGAAAPRFRCEAMAIPADAVAAMA